ncbi:MAG: glycosyltransferase family 39 protein, partial [Chloroflexota bacterium]
MAEKTNTHSKPNHKSLNWDWLAPNALALILLLGAVLRLSGINWDEDQHLHPDERFLTMVESAISIPGLDKPIGPLPPNCTKWGGYFNTECSPLSPYNHNFGLFVYGTFPIFLTRLLGEFFGQTGYGEIHLLGRILSALFDLSTVLLIFFIGRRLYGVRAALLGALFLAASALDIQQSHFFTVDTFTNVPILLAFWCALDIAEGKHWRAFVWAGAAFGLALAGRINIAPFAAVLIAAGALRAWRAARGTLESPDAPESLDRGPQTADGETSAVGGRSSPVTLEDVLFGKLTRAFFGLAGAAVVALIVFRTFQPYAANGPNFISFSFPKFDASRGAVNVLLDVALSWAGGVNPKFADNMSYIGELVAGRQDYPPGHQWTNRPAYIFPFENMVLWGLGLPLGLAAWAGFAFALYRLIRYREWQHLLIVVWVGVTFGYTGQQWVKTLRYFLQIYPFLALLAGNFLVTLWDWATADRRPQTADSSTPLRSAQNDGGGRVARVVVAIIALIVIGYTLFWATAFATIYTRPVSRVTASRWIFQNVPPGSILANEHWDDPLPLRIDGKDPFGGMYRSLPSSSGDGLMHWYDEDTPEKRAQAIQWIDNAEYIVLSSNRLYGSIPRLPMRYPLTTKYYEWLFDGTLGFDKIAEITSRPQLFGIEIDDDNAEEAFTVYDHPKVLIFKKAPRYSHAQVAALFDGVDLTEVYRFWPREATLAPTALLLAPADRDAQTRGGTWSQIFNPDDWINRVPVIVWLVLIEVLGWLAFPIAFVALRALADRGYIFAKAIGILLP